MKISMEKGLKSSQNFVLAMSLYISSNKLASYSWKRPYETIKISFSEDTE